jgi:hypothetical protein
LGGGGGWWAGRDVKGGGVGEDGGNGASGGDAGYRRQGWLGVGVIVDGIFGAGVS